jgi:hypothetical protein
MTVMPKSSYEVKWIPVGSLSVLWASAQRGLTQSKVEKIKEGFDPDAIGVLAVTMPNGKGVYHVIDGQHRRQAVLELWGDSQRVPCTILPGRTEKEAAHIWSLMNGDRTMPTAIDKFRVAVTAGYADEVAVNNIIRDFGYKISGGFEDGYLSAVAACLAIYRKRGPEALSWTLDTIQQTWGKSRDGVHAATLRGYADLLAAHPSVDQARLVTKVAKQYTPARLIGAARTAHDMFKGTLGANVVRILVQTYNHKLKTGARLGEDA